MAVKLALSFGTRLELDLLLGETAPDATDAVIVPQDTQGIMGTCEEIEAPRESTPQLLAASSAAKPRTLRPGTILEGPARAGGPLVLEAVVYDFGRTPSVCEDHVFEALLLALEEARMRGLASVALRPLGTEHGGLDERRFLELLGQLCYSAAEMGTSLRHVRLLLPSSQDRRRYWSWLQTMARPLGGR